MLVLGFPYAIVLQRKLLIKIVFIHIKIPFMFYLKRFSCRNHHTTNVYVKVM